MRKRKWMAAIMLIALCLSLAGCNEKDGDKKSEAGTAGTISEDTKDSGIGEDGVAGDGAVDDSAPEECEAEAEPGSSEVDGAEGAYDDAISSEDKSCAEVSEKDMVSLDTESDADMDVPEAEDEAAPEDNIDEGKAGTLTAGEWNDNDNWGFFLNLARTGNLLIPTFGINPVNRVMVNVTSAGKPAENVLIKLQNEAGATLYTSRTDYSGTAYVFYNVYNSNDIPYQVTVNAEGKDIETKKLGFRRTDDQSGQNKYQDSKDSSKPEDNRDNVEADMNVSFDIAASGKTEGIDIMFLFDTTGSMGDELLYLQKEFSDITERVNADNARFSVDFYRDHEDDYVTKFNPFTDSKKAQKQLNNESVDGGGDYEEAVEEALVEGVKSEWRDEAVKLLFIILDAPPHRGAKADAYLKDTIEKASKKGIRIIPIASSGVDFNTEVLMRTLAIMTGGTYTFLTDDSGVGGTHLQPTVGKYDVEKLNDLIVKIINRYVGA